MTLWAQYDWDEECMRSLEEAYQIYMDYLHGYVMGDVELDELDTETTDGFCGCEICWRRETFAFLMPRFIELYKGHQIWDRTQHTHKEDRNGLQLVSDSGNVEPRGGGQ